jgi:hypothetical protein
VHVETLTHASYDARHAWSIEHMGIEHVDLVNAVQISMAYVLSHYKISFQTFRAVYATWRFVTTFTAFFHWLLF